jgi:hypothetical protein
MAVLVRCDFVSDSIGFPIGPNIMLLLDAAIYGPKTDPMIGPTWQMLDPQCHTIGKGMANYG